MTRRIVPGLIAAVTLSAAYGCVIETVAVPIREPLVQVHAILNLGQADQGIFVERVIGGVGTGTNDEGGAVAISGAKVTVTGPNGYVFKALEKVDTTESVEAGLPPTIDERSRRYEFRPLPPNVLVPDGLYQLRVETPEGEVVTGSTRIPSQASVSTSPVRQLNRDRDTLALTWPLVSSAAAYWVRADGLTTAYSQFLDVTHIRLRGDLRSLEFDEDRKSVFTPGFQTIVTVAAVDQNCYDYFRSGNDPFTGLGRLNRLVGGYGVFGSMVIVLSTRVEVTADVTDPKVEGRWVLLTGGPAASARARELRLFADRANVTSDTSITPLIGSYERPNASPARQPVYGSRNGVGVTIGLFRGTALSGSADDVFVGSIRADTLRGSYTSDGLAAVFVRR